MKGLMDFNVDRSIRDMFETGRTLAGVHPVLLNSWKRSRQYSVDPFIDYAPMAERREIMDMEELLLTIAEPYFNYFSSLLMMSECGLSLSNADGVLIRVDTKSRRLLKYAEKHNFQAGALWSEKGVGSNAIGLALEEKKDVFMQGCDHYSYGWHPYCCAASPVFHPQNREVIGVVDLTGFYNELNVHSLGWVSSLARLLEAGVGMHILKKGEMKKPVKANFFIEKDFKDNQPSDAVGRDPVFLRALYTAERIADTDLNVLLTGETGSGKEVFARRIHRLSSRADGPFVAVNCGAIPRDLMASELFGYSGGAFTGASKQGHPGRFEQADGGTIFLDEIGDAPVEIQVGLLRVIEEGCVYRLGSVRPIPINVRVLAATSRDLNVLVEEGAFRRDIYFRLSGININIPPLRERPEDILLLAEYFLDLAGSKRGRAYRLGDGLKKALMGYSWPGNVREMRNMIDCMVALSDSETLDCDLFERLAAGKKLSCASAVDLKKSQLVSLLRDKGGNIGEVADELGVNRSTVYRRMKKWGIDRNSGN
ncbi:MAG: sigma-54-dependent Fis family transcriptional regulator [Bacillota bacterium]